jgi:hypothetical protein
MSGVLKIFQTLVFEIRLRQQVTSTYTLLGRMCLYIYFVYILKLNGNLYIFL